MAVYGFIAKLLMPADSEFPAQETACVQICAYSSVRATTIRIISHIKMNKNVLF